MTQRFFYNIVLILLTLISSWLVWYFVIDFSFEKPPNPYTPDSYANQLTVTVMNDAGDKAYRFFSPELKHYPEGDRTEFSLPHLTLFEKNATPWELTASSGISLKGGDQINFQDNVTLTQNKTRIVTPRLTVYPKKRLLFSDETKGVYAEPAKPPLYISADHSSLDRLTGIGVFTGNVKLVRETNTLNTPKLTLYFDAHDQLIKAIAEGPGTVFQSHRDPTKPPFVATADVMQYFPANSEIYLIGNAKAVQGANSYISPKIHYYIDKETVASHEGRTTIILQPSTLKSHP
jgi:lipopolysaccharide export system protein LptA